MRPYRYSSRRGESIRVSPLLSDSPAIDAGSNAIAAALERDYDQRGEDFDRILDWDEDLDVRVDIGAFELALDELYT